MREILFRTPMYDIKTNKFNHFSYWGAIDYNGKTSKDGSFTSPGTSSHCYKKWHEQYSGLKDANGKEIYEGDIILWGGDSTFIVKFQIGEFKGIELSGPVPGDLHYYNFNNSELIGNIHDNPELL